MALDGQQRVPLVAGWQDSYRNGRKLSAVTGSDRFIGETLVKEGLAGDRTRRRATGVGSIDITSHHIWPSPMRPRRDRMPVFPACKRDILEAEAACGLLERQQTATGRDQPVSPEHFAVNNGHPQRKRIGGSGSSEKCRRTRP